MSGIYKITYDKYQSPTANKDTNPIPPAVERKKKKSKAVAPIIDLVNSKVSTMFEISDSQKPESEVRGLLRRSSLVVRENNKISTCNASTIGMCIVGINSDSSGIFIEKGAKPPILGLIVNDNNYINIGQLIGYGSYGKVYVLPNIEKPRDYYVFKDFDRLDDYIAEKIISLLIHNLQSNNNNIYNVISSYWYESYNKNLILMHGRSGNLTSLFKYIKYNPINLFLQIINSVFDLYKIGIYYCDMKPENLLYRRNMYTDIEIILADIGGLFFHPDNVYSNILLGLDMEGSEISFEYFSENSMIIKVSNNFIGYVLTNDKMSRLIGNNFKVVNIEGKLVLQNNVNKEIVDTPLYIIFKEISFTYPHYQQMKKTGKGFYSVNPDMNGDEMRSLLMNNIFQSLGILLIGLYFKEIEYYKPFIFDEVVTNFDEVKEKVIKSIPPQFPILEEILFDNLIMKEMVNYKNDMTVSNMFEKIIKLCNQIK